MGCSGLKAFEPSWTHTLNSQLCNVSVWTDLQLLHIDHGYGFAVQSNPQPAIPLGDSNSLWFGRGSGSHSPMSLSWHLRKDWHNATKCLWKLSILDECDGDAGDDFKKWRVLNPKTSESPYKTHCVNSKRLGDLSAIKGFQHGGHRKEGAMLHPVA